MAFFSVIVEAAVKMADIAESKLLIVHETSDGSRRLAGHDDLIASFKSGDLVSRLTDSTYGKPEASFGVFVSSDESKNGDRVRNHLKKRAANHSEFPGSRKRRKCNEMIEIDADDSASDIKPALNNEEDFELVEDGVEEILGVEYEDSLLRDDPMTTADDLSSANKYSFSGSLIERTENVTDGGSHWGESDHQNKPPGRPKKGQIRVINPPKKSNQTQVVKKRCKFCPNDDRTLYTIGSYKYHVAAVHERKQACPFCDKGFKDRYHMKRHVNSGVCLKSGIGSIPREDGDDRVANVSQSSIIGSTEESNELTSEASVSKL